MKKELLSILLFFLVVVTSVSLLSFSPLDPSINHQPFSSGEIHNLFGLVGAYLSGFLILFLGVASFFIPIFIFLFAFLYIRDNKIMEISSFIAGGVLLMISFASILSVLKEKIPIRGRVIPSGGIIGSIVSDFFLKYTNTTGSTIIFTFCFFYGVVIISEIPASAVIEKINRYIFIILRFVGLKAVEAHEMVMSYIRKLLSDQREGGFSHLGRITPFRLDLKALTFNRDRFQEDNRGGKHKNSYKSDSETPATDSSDEDESESIESEFQNDISLPNGTDEQEKTPSREKNPAVQKISSKIFPILEAVAERMKNPGSGGRGSEEIFSDEYSPENEDEAEERPAELFSDFDQDMNSAVFYGSEVSYRKISGRDSVDQDHEENFNLPHLELLNEKKVNDDGPDMDLLRQKAIILEDKLRDFGVKGEIVDILPGPVITTFEYRPAPGVKISKIVNLTDDLALALSALSIRIVAPIPGKDVVGIEIPNDRREMVVLKDLLASRCFCESSSKLTLGLGKDILGNPVSAAMDSMPHLLIAGATGTGKSVGLNAMIISLLYKAKPGEVKFIMVDPKRIELSVYDGIPHLISPVVTDMKKATNALFWAVREMERRYELLAHTGVRNLLQYNNWVDSLISAKGSDDKNVQSSASEIDNSTDYSGVEDDRYTHPADSMDEGDDNELPEKLPYIVVIVDEFADLMMVASRDVESALIRLAQMARAAGIHLILATQRPSVDVLTGIIKANFPTRISFQVSSRIDSRTILDTNGAERLLGSGDMLFLPPGTGRLQRIQGAYISEEEIARVTAFVKDQQQPNYVEDVTEKSEGGEDVEEDDYYDEKYDEAVALVLKTRQASISSVQRHLRIGYNRAARIIETMEKEGLVGPQDGSKPREILAKSYDD